MKFLHNAVRATSDTQKSAIKQFTLIASIPAAVGLLLVFLSMASDEIDLPRAALQVGAGLIFGTIVAISMGLNAARSENVRSVEFGVTEKYRAVLWKASSTSELSGTDFPDDFPLHRGYFPKADFTRSRMVGIDLSEATLIGADFGGCMLKDASFAKANLSYAKFPGAEVQGANFNGADLTGADFSSAIFDAATCWDAGQLSDIKLPAGLVVDEESLKVVPAS